MTLPLPGLAYRAPIKLRSRLLYSWDATRGLLTARSGQAATFARTVNATAVDVNGTTYTAIHSQPRWESVDLNADSIRETPGLLLGADDALDYPLEALPQAVTLYAKVVERGSLAGSDGVLSWGADSGAHLRIASTGTAYQAFHHNGTSSVTSTAAAAPTTDQLVELRAVFQSDGKVQLGQSINSAAEVVAALSGALTLAAAWSTTRLYFNRSGAANVGTALFLAVKVAIGAPTLAQLRSWR